MVVLVASATSTEAPAETVAAVAMAASSAVTAATADRELQAVSAGAPVVPAGPEATRSPPETAVAAVMAGSGELVQEVAPVAGEATPPSSATAAMVVPAVMAALQPGIADREPAVPAALVVPAASTVATAVPVAMAAGVD